LGAATVHVERVVVGVLNSAKQHVIRVLHELRCGWPIHRIQSSPSTSTDNGFDAVIVIRRKGPPGAGRVQQLGYND